VIWKGPLREDDREQQIQVVEGFASQGVNGIVLAPLDNRALARPVEEAKTAGVPTVEAGTDEENRGLVRVGPYHTCTPAMGTALVGVAMLPDCIRGRNKQ